MMRQIQSKKIQILQNSQQLFLAKCLVEQQLEQTQRNTQISLKGNHDGSVLFRVAKTKEIAAFAIHSKLYVFAKPLPDFKGLPLDTKVVSLNDIVKTNGVMRCTKCKSWVNTADVTKCPCGGYLQARKRFHVRGETTESLDAEYLEIQSALKDIRISAKMEHTPRAKPYIPTGITASMAGMSSVETTTTAYTGFLTAVAVKSGKKQPNKREDKKHMYLKDEEKYSFFKGMGVDVESIQDEQIKAYGMLDAQRMAKIAVDSWNSIPIDVEEMHLQKRKQSVRKQRLHQNHTHKPTQNKPSSKKKMMICSGCAEKTPALVESKCTKCFLNVAN